MRRWSSVKQISEIDGVEVVEQRPAYGTHPHPSQNGRQVEYDGVDHLLLADGQELYACVRDPHCAYVRDNVRSVVSHLVSHSPGKNDPATPEEVIKDVIRTVRTEIRDHGAQNAFNRAADELNRRGVKPYRAEEWNRGTVASIFNRYAQDYPNVRPRSARPTRVVKASSTPGRSANAGSHAAGDFDREKTLAMLDELEREISQATATIGEIRQQLLLVADRVQVEVDPEIVEKARKFDAMQSMLRS
jgi:hypothetical protein